jgi:hypothetical protein
MNEETLPVKPDDFEGWLSAYTELQQQYSALRSEYYTVIKTIIRALDALGMWPVTAENMNLSGIGKKLPGLIIDAMMPGSQLKEKFAFMKDIFPIAEKYKDINVNDL